MPPWVYLNWVLIKALGFHIRFEEFAPESLIHPQELSSTIVFLGVVGSTRGPPHHQRRSLHLHR